jgi:hypothetical protein
VLFFKKITGKSGKAEKRKSGKMKKREKYFFSDNFAFVLCSINRQEINNSKSL